MRRLRPAGAVSGSLSILASAVLLLTSCQQPAPRPAEQASAPGAASPAAKSIPVITLSQPADAVTMDPAKVTQVLTGNYFYNLYDTLTRWDSDLKLVPGLATAWKSVGDTSWEFELRQGVKFHDGSELTAADVKTTLDRVRDSQRAAAVQPGFATIQDVTIADPRTIRITTAAPDPLMPVRMAQTGAQIYPARLAATEEGTAELARNPIGSGAYKFVEWVKDDRLVMEANRDWWGWQGQPPVAERVIWKPIPDDFARVSALQKGEVDVITNVPSDHLNALESGATTEVVTVSATRSAVFFMNATEPPLSDVRVRQALHHALDVDSIIKNLYAGKGKPMSGGLADTDFGYNPSLKPYPYDPDKARQLLAAAGHPNAELSLYAGTGTMINDKQLLESVADMWSRVGIKAKVVMMEMANRQKVMNDRAIAPNSLLLSNPQSTLLDADGSLWRLLHPNGLSGRYWSGSQPDHRFHRLMEEARSTLDQEKRKRLYTEATEILHEDKPWLELFQEEVVYGTSKRVSLKPRPDYRLIVSEIKVK